MKNRIVLSFALGIGFAVSAVSIVTQSDEKKEYGEENFYFYVKNNTGEDISFCKKSSNSLIYKPGVRLRITEDDLEIEDRGEKYTSKAWIEVGDLHKIEIYQLHGNFYIETEHEKEPIELQLKHIYEIYMDDENHIHVEEIAE